jgi:hypothetical protein
MKTTRVIIVIGFVVVVALGGLAGILSGIYTSPSTKFHQELAYYEDMDYAISYCSLDDYYVVIAELFETDVLLTFREEVSKEELREIVSRDSSGGEDGEIIRNYLVGKVFKSDLLDVDRFIPDVSYDEEALIIWVTDHSAETNWKTTIFTWSPE